MEHLKTNPGSESQSNLEDKTEESHFRHWPLVISVAAFLFCLPAFFLRFYPSTDFAAYYGPMIREFARGNYAGAYYPMIPPLVPTLGGILAGVFGMDAFSAGKLVSMAFFALTIFPLYHLHKNIFSEKIAIVACFLFILCTRLMRYASSGLLETGKIFFLVSLAWGIWEMANRPRWFKAVLIGFAAAGLTLVRGEGLVFAVLGLAALAIIEAWRHRQQWHRVLLPYWALMAIGVFLITMAPWLRYQREMTGYPVADSRQITIFQKAYDFVGAARPGPGKMPGESFTPENRRDLDENSEGVVRQPQARADFWHHIWNRLIVEWYLGLYPEYLPFLLTGIFLCFRKREWTPWKWFLAATFLFHTFAIILMLGGTWIQKRYMIHAMPFLLGWTSMGVLAAYDWLSPKMAASRKLKTAGVIALTVFSAVTLYRGNRKGLEDWQAMRQDESKVKNAYLAAQFIREHARHETQSDDYARLHSTNRHYHSSAHPPILTTNPRVSFLARGDGVLPRQYPEVRGIPELIELAKFKAVGYIVIDHTTFRSFPEPEAQLLGQTTLRYIFSVGDENRIDVFGLRE